MLTPSFQLHLHSLTLPEKFPNKYVKQICESKTGQLSSENQENQEGNGFTHWFEDNWFQRLSST